MTTRLVLGSGPVGMDLLSDLQERPGSVLVVTDDEHRLDTLRSREVRVVRADPDDRDALERLSIEPVSILVSAGDAATNRRTARAARDVFPGAVLIAYAGDDATLADRDAIGAVADEVVDPAGAVADHLLYRVGDESVRVRHLRRVLRDLDGPLAIVTHDNPDPDAIASSVALGRIADAVGREADVCYYGDISHQENRAFVNLLEIDLVNLEPGADLSRYGGFALVDHSRPGVNDQLPPDTSIDVVIDHHPPRGPIAARFADVREQVGATSTLLVDYLRRTDTPLDETVATALLFGISVDTREFRREVSAADFEAAAAVLPQADLDVLQRIEQPSMSADTLDTIARAIRNSRREGSVLLSCVGELSDRDALAQAADRLLDLQDVSATLVYGVKGGTIYVSARARGRDLDLGETLRDAFGQIGSAGGHADMAGAQITLGVLESVEDRDESLHEVVRSVVDDRFLDALETHAGRPPGQVYASTGFDAATEYVERDADGE